MWVPLELLSAGEWAEIGEVSGDAACVARLGELGLRPGARVQMIQPGSPCLVRLDGVRLALRPDCADHVLVEPVPAGAVAGPVAARAG
jgi:Fe2+ transport system protein FeoA